MSYKKKTDEEMKINDLLSELKEQARLVGIGTEREARLETRIKVLRDALASILEDPYSMLEVREAAKKALAEDKD